MKNLKLKIYWSEKEQDFIVSYPRKGDSGWIIDRILGDRKTIRIKSNVTKKDNPELTYYSDISVRDSTFDWSNRGVYDLNFIKELEDRGFDKKTLKFEVKIKLEELTGQFSHLIEKLSAKDKVKLNKILKSRKLETIK